MRRILALLLLVSFSVSAKTKIRGWQPAIVTNIESRDAEIDKPNGFIILTEEYRYTVETEDTIYTLRNVTRRLGHPLDLTLHGKTQIAIDGSDAHLLDDAGKDVKLTIMLKEAKRPAG